MMYIIGGYYEIPFKAQRGVTQAHPLSPTISKVVVDAMLHNRVLVVAETEGEVGSKGFVRGVQRLVVYLYADNGLLVYMRSERIKRVFHVLMDLIYWVGICTNVGNMVSMEYQPCCALVGHSAEEYGLRMTGAEGNPSVNTMPECLLS